MHLARFFITVATIRHSIDILDLAFQRIAPQDPQYNSLRLLSLCMAHKLHAGQGGNPFSLAFTDGPLKIRFLVILNHPFFGIRTFGMTSLNLTKRYIVE